MLKKISFSLDETLTLATQLALEIQSDDLLLLKGNLGAGKTTFIKALAYAINQTPPAHVHSPTYSYLNTYYGTPTIYHFDLYRIETPETFQLLGFDEHLFSQGVCCIEWPERVPYLSTLSHWEIHLEHKEETQRWLTYERKEGTPIPI